MRTQLATATEQLHNTKALLKVTKAQLARQLSDLRRLHLLSTRLSAHVELQTLLNEVLAAVCQLQRAPMGLLMLYDGERQDLHAVASVGLDTNIVRKLGRIPLGTGLCGVAVLERRHHVARDLEREGGFDADRAFARATGARAMSCSPLQSRTGQVIGAIATYFKAPRRLTAREMQLVSLYGGQASEFIENARQYAEVREASRLKDEFLATISHEIRTPLNAVLGWTKVLQMPGTSATEGKGARALEAIERNSRIQAQLVEDLLDISRIVAGKMQMTFEPVSLAATVDAALDTVRPAADNKQLEIQVHAPTDIIVSGDPGRLQQVVWNLLINAVRFTPEKGRIDVRLQRTGASAQLAVVDSGIGIPSEFLPNVFDRFRQADGDPQGARRGLGLGLAIVRHVVEAHGGEAAATSDGPGRGATFTVTLPLAADAVPVNKAPEELPVAPASLRDVHVLVVEDEVDTRDLLTTALESYGAVVTPVASGVDALTALKSQTYDVLVADIGMADMNGYALIRTVRALANQADRPLPAIALTVYASTTEREDALAAGYDRHVVKPIDPDRLAAVIQEVIARSAEAAGNR
jgi:signal transduction histidine kinase/ActR/RegA family two-component response regulator